MIRGGCVTQTTMFCCWMEMIQCISSSKPAHSPCTPPFLSLAPGKLTRTPIQMGALWLLLSVPFPHSWLWMLNEWMTTCKSFLSSKSNRHKCVIVQPHVSSLFYSAKRCHCYPCTPWVVMSLIHFNQLGLISSIFFYNWNMSMPGIIFLMLQTYHIPPSYFSGVLGHNFIASMTA